MSFILKFRGNETAAKSPPANTMKSNKTRRLPEQEG